MSSDDSVSLTEHSFVKTEVLVFKFRQHGKDHVLHVPVQIPLETTVKELAYRIINCHSVSCYVEDGKKRYTLFVVSHSMNIHDEF